jgi:hypothetical protein
MYSTECRSASRPPRSAVVVVVEHAARLPEELRLVEEVPLVLGDGEARALLEQARRPPALVAMVVRLQHPFDARDPERPQAIEHGARPRIDDERGVAVHHHVGVAGVGEREQVLRDAGEVR